MQFLALQRTVVTIAGETSASDAAHLAPRETVATHLSEHLSFSLSQFVLREKANHPVIKFPS